MADLFIEKILSENKPNYEDINNIMFMIKKILQSVMIKKLEKQGFSEKTIEKKILLCATGSQFMNTSIKGSDLDLTLILSKCVWDFNVLESLKGLPCIKNIEENFDKPVNLIKLKFDNDVEVDVCSIFIEDLVPTNFSDAVIGFKDMKSKTAAKGFKLKEVS